MTSTEEQIRREAETPKTKTLVASISEYGWRMIEAEFTMTLYYLAQVCTRLQRSSDAAFYCQQTLSRQYARGEYDPVEWSKNAIVLSYFYMGELMFKQAHYCLSAAQCIMNKFPDRFHPVIENTVDKDDPDTPEEVIVADLARSWGTFYLNMLLTSRNNYLSKLQALQTRSGLAEMKEEKKESIYENISTDTTMSLFEDLELPEETPECNLAMLFSEARDLFKQGFNWFNIAKMFYILDGYVSDHIRILQNVSQLYKYLSDFETDLARICKMHKRRINMLEPLIDDISPKAYLEFYQQCADEVAKSYAEMMELKYAINKHRPAHMAKERAKAQQKINELALKAVQNYQIWLNSFSKDGLPPKTLEKDYQRHFLLAMFTVARLFGKIFHTNPQTYIVVLKKSLAQYESVVETVDRFEAMDVFKDEYAICKEMIHLLPLKMSKIMRTGLCFME